MTSKRSDTELLELRRKVLEALGWTYWASLTNGWIFLPPNEPESSSIRSTIRVYDMIQQDTLAVEHLDGNTPALESNNGLALDALDKLCAERKLYWDLRRITTRGELDYFACRIGNFKVGPDAAVVTTDTGTPALAIVNAIIAASAKGDAK